MIEFAGLGPTPFAGMMLADYGAEVLRIERAGAPPYLGSAAVQYLNRSRASIVLDLKDADGHEFANRLLGSADVLLEGYRPGVMERLGLGPETVCAAHPRLVYARMSGWGQNGPLARAAGHDINYLALSGALHAMGPGDAPPVPPLNLVGDFGGGGMLVVGGILAALVERAGSGRGQLVDAAMLDGAALLFTQIAGWQAGGLWTERRGDNLLDGGAYFYRCYDTADGKFMAVGALEENFHDAFLAGLGFNPCDFPDRLDRRHWDARADRIAARFRARSRAEWTDHFDRLDACVSPVLTLAEAAAHPANVERKVFAGLEPEPAPRFSRTPARRGAAPAAAGSGGLEALRDWAGDDRYWQTLIARGILHAD
ncbi:alpha-methylacyl-CoA racemase [Sphingomonas astaxanthinifaciens DSM 22298]|uniref:Alpha-methylacyl-CoA racemase n=1 Tax=Sphingomonas astaxanthinifaciens DSM 22298 TaxID=1123267 RepID=A0ABQ5Z1M7_9SPHN|nr:alpha-methylacyl-CoA racemase [Sphingomonas astaxanthinifaciens DSM 22298]